MMAAFVIFSNISMITFMVCFSLSQAISIVSAAAFGKRNAKEILRSAKAGAIIMSGAVLILCALIYYFHTSLFGIFTKDTQVIGILSGLVIYLIMEIVLDTLPLGIMGSLNGRGDVKIPTIFQAIAFLGVRISACYILGFGLSLGLKGLVLGLAVGGVTSFLLNGSRFIYLTRRDKRQGVY